MSTPGTVWLVFGPHRLAWFRVFKRQTRDRRALVLVAHRRPVYFDGYALLGWLLAMALA